MTFCVTIFMTFREIRFDVPGFLMLFFRSQLTLYVIIATEILNSCYSISHAILKLCNYITPVFNDFMPLLGPFPALF